MLSTTHEASLGCKICQQDDRSEKDSRSRSRVPKMNGSGQINMGAHDVTGSNDSSESAGASIPAWMRRYGGLNGFSQLFTHD
jgi:hypothetical protein